MECRGPGFNGARKPGEEAARSTPDRFLVFHDIDKCWLPCTLNLEEYLGDLSYMLQGLCWNDQAVVKRVVLAIIVALKEAQGDLFASAELDHSCFHEMQCT